MVMFADSMLYSFAQKWRTEQSSSWTAFTKSDLYCTITIHFVEFLVTKRYLLLTLQAFLSSCCGYLNVEGKRGEQLCKSEQYSNERVLNGSSSPSEEELIKMLMKYKVRGSFRPAYPLV